jgi:hypothetical protein
MGSALHCFDWGESTNIASVVFGYMRRLGMHSSEFDLFSQSIIMRDTYVWTGLIRPPQRHICGTSICMCMYSTVHASYQLIQKDC